MRLYLVRHGQSNPENIDPQKGLSPVGEAEIGLLARSIRHLNIDVEEIWHSGKTRAVRTADIISTAIKTQKGIIEKAGLKANDPVEPIVQEIIALNINLMLVGHLPFMAKMASYLLSGNENKCAIDFLAGAIACFEYDRREWILDWLAFPGMFMQENKHGFYSYH